MAWFEDYPERLDLELESLTSRGLQFEINEAAKAQGQLQIAIDYPFDKRVVKLVARYPDVFPYFPPEVHAPDEHLSRHQHPNGGNLCLIGRRTIQWDNDDTIGVLLEQRLNLILEFDKTQDPTVLEGREEPQGEPVSEYIHGGAPLGGYALYESEMQIPAEVMRGRMSAQYKGSKNHRGEAVAHIQISEIKDSEKNILAAKTGPDLVIGKGINFPWVRVDPPPSGSIEEISERHNGGEFDFPGFSQLSDRHPHDFFALVYKEEVRLGEFADAISLFERKLIKKGKKGTELCIAVRTFRVGPTDLAARMPGVNALSQRHVAIFGLGALGSPVALELARNGVGRLTLVDFDFVDPATVRRWAFGVSSFGKAKAFALRDFLLAEYPWTQCQPMDLKIGEASGPSPINQMDQLSSLVSDVDIVVDLSAEVAVNQLLSDLCHLNGKAYICASSTPGAWGGLVFQWRPDRSDKCWMCMRHFIYPEWDGLPPADPEGDNQPPGCPARTFTGSSFDLMEIGLEVVRAVVSAADADSYPDTPWQLSVCKLRNGAERTLPEWSGHEIPARTGCAC